MAEITLVAETGRGTGSGPAKRMRAEGRVPGVVYGRGTEPTSVSVEWRSLRAALTTEAGMNALIRLQVDGEKHLTIVKELQRHPVRRQVLHVDFLVIDPNREIEVEVPIVLEGEALEVINNQGVVEHMLTALLVRVKPSDIPPHITVDISALEVGQTITVGDLTLPAGVATDVDADRPVVGGMITRMALAEEEEAEAAEGEEGEEGAEGEAGAAADTAPSEGGGGDGDGGQSAGE
jgi:large subunit ribosomal protein L25